ncbi:MAG: extracellular solute-binding protein [Chloroflexi bacterium]|nr:extracellular solute-binding protein [Chloroflexota bacterium]
MSEQMSRRDLLKLMGAGSAGLALSACAPQVVTEVREVEVPVEQTVVVRETMIVETTMEPAPGYEEGELTILLCCSSPEDVDHRAQWNEEWVVDFPGVTVKQDTVPAGQSYFEKLQTLIAAGTMPDLYDMWEGYIQPYAANGALVNLDPFFEADDKVKKDDLVPAAFDGGAWQNSVYAFCQGFMPGPISLYYNVDHFDAAGLDYPTSDWTWDDMRATAQELTDVPNRWGLVYSLWFVPWLYWIWSNGGDLFNEDETQCTLTDPKAYEALQYWADMVLIDETTLPSTEAQALQGPENAFQTGMVSMYLGNCWDVPAFEAARDETGFNWGAVLSPKAPDGNRVWYEHFWCWGMSTQTTRPNVAWLYMRDFILDQVNQAAQPMVPSLKQLLHIFATEKNRELGLEPLITLATEPGLLRVPGAGEKFDKISGIAQAEIDLVFIGEETAEQAATNVCPKIDEELARG